MPQYLFSYGTLQSTAVQEVNFGRALPINPETLPGFRIDNDHDH